MKKKMALRRLVLSKQAKVALMAAAVLLVVGSGSLIAAYVLHRSHESTTVVPQTGVALRFTTPLRSSNNLDIYNSEGQKVETLALVQRPTPGLRNAVLDPSGSTYYIPLHEGVYQLKLLNDGNGTPLFTVTATISDHRLTTETISFAALP